VFRQFSFMTTVAQALAQGNFQTGDIPAVWLELPANSSRDAEAARSWSAPELKKLALLALRADQQARQREAITFAGNPRQIEGALEASFLAVPTSLRPRCSFDTYFYHCNLVATYFWGIGLPELPVSIKFALVDGSSRQVHGAAPSQPETAYQRWALAAIEAGHLDEIVRERDNAFALAEWLDGRADDTSSLDAASPELVTAVFQVNPQPVRALLRRRVDERVPSALVDRIAQHIYQGTGAIALYQQLRQGFELTELADSLYAGYAAQDFEEPPREEVKALESLFEQVDYPLLRLFWAYWHSPRKGLPRELERVDGGTYRQFGEIALRLELVEPLRLLVPKRGEAFLDLYLAPDVEDLVGLVEALMEVEETACLSRLAGYVPSLSAKDLKKLARLIEKQPDTSESLQLAVEEAMAVPPPEKGIKGVLRRVRRRLPGGGQGKM
jgi:hypothetical protein